MFIINYKKYLKPVARKLRKRMTVHESLMWLYLRKKQIRNVQFYRQKTIGKYIVDFYAPCVKLVIELDGSQHLEPKMLAEDQCRDAYLNSLGLNVMRFENGHVERALDLILREIDRYIQDF